MKKKREVFTCKLQACLKFKPFENREAQYRESARVRKRDLSPFLAVALSHSRSLALTLSSLALF